MAVLILAVFTAAGAFGFSIGGGVSGDFNAAVSTIGNEGDVTSLLGGYIFLDFSFIEINTIFGFDVIKKDNPTSLNFGIIGKFPINLGFLCLFPALGVDLFTTFPKDSDKDFFNDFSDNLKIGLLAGGGLDIVLGKFFIRGQIFYTLRIPTKDDKVALSTVKTLNNGVKFMLGAGFKLF